MTDKEKEFIKVEDVVFILRKISESLLPCSNIGQVEFTRRSIQQTINELEKK